MNEAVDDRHEQVFNLIGSFTNAPDPRLRANALYALAALASSGRTDLSRRSREQFLHALISEPTSGIGQDRERRFGVRAVDALKEFNTEDRAWIAQELMRTLSATGDPAQRRAIARLSLDTWQFVGPLPRDRWFKYVMSIWNASRQSFWASVGAVLWRAVVVWALLALAVVPTTALTLDEFIESALTPLPLGLAAVSTAVLLSPGGEFLPSRTALVIDTLVCAGCFCLLAVLAVLAAPSSFVPADPSLVQLASVAVLGAVIGAATRMLRWAGSMFRVGESAVGPFMRPLIALVFSTAACIAAVARDVDVGYVSAAWVALAPAAMLCAWVDMWLERRGPQPLIERRRPSERQWLLPMLAALALIYSSYQIYERSTPPEVDRSALLKGLSKYALTPQSVPKEVAAEFGKPFVLQIADRSDYHIEVREEPDEDLVLTMYDDVRWFEIYDDPPIASRQFAPGNYLVCVSHYAAPDHACPDSHPLEPRFETLPSSLLDLASEALTKGEARHAGEETSPVPPVASDSESGADLGRRQRSDTTVKISLRSHKISEEASP